jgi:hypothetical protein
MAAAIFPKEDSMDGDVKLDENYSNWVTIDGDVIHARTRDFMLDSPGRRGQGGGERRRALVHDRADGLTLNYNKDYPGGITLNAVSYISPKAPQMPRSDVPVDIDVRVVQGLRRVRVPELVIDGGIQFVWDNGVSLQKLIKQLQDQVADLTQRVTALEA